MTGGPPSPHASARSPATKTRGVNRSAKRRAKDTSSNLSGAHGKPHGVQPGPAKVAIPRLGSDDLGEHTKFRNAKVDRTNHACEPCRNRKTKCSGERPTCKHCWQFNITCIYADGKRDRDKRFQEGVQQKAALYETLLLEAGPSLGPSLWSRFQRARSIEEDDSTRLYESGQGIEYDVGEPSKGENARAASEGSIDDSVTEDISKDAESQAAGYIGRASGVDWQRNINTKENDFVADLRSSSGDHAAGAGIPAASMSYQTNQIPNLNLSDADLLPYSAPHYSEAKYMTEVFFERVYPSFQVLPQTNFKQQLDRAYSGGFGSIRRPGGQWQAIMNLVFAIAARSDKMAGATAYQVGVRHEIYFARAARLGLDQRSRLDLSDLQQVQIFSLSSFYLLSINNIGRSWSLAGDALRSAIALGLHVEIQSDELGEHAKEARYRLWWAIYGLEVNLMIVTGRPSGVSVGSFSTPLPVPYDEETFDLSRGFGTGIKWARFKQGWYRFNSGSAKVGTRSSLSNLPSRSSSTEEDLDSESLSNIEMSGAIFSIFRSKLCLVVHDILESLYQPAAANQLWSQIQAGIQHQNAALDEWRLHLPAALNFQTPQNDSWSDYREHLALFFYSAKIIVTRPCLCEVPDTAPHESAESLGFNLECAQTCIRSALAIVGLLPRDINTSRWAQRGSWWMLVHYLFSTVTVLTIALFYDCRHIGQDQKGLVVRAAKHGIAWLYAMAQEPNQGAERAWRITSASFARISQRMGIDTRNVPIATQSAVYSHVPGASRVDDPPEDPFASPSGQHVQGDFSEQHPYPGLSSAFGPDTVLETGLDPVFGHMFTSYPVSAAYPAPSMGDLNFGDTSDPFFAIPTSSVLDPLSMPYLGPQPMPTSVGTYLIAQGRESTAEDGGHTGPTVQGQARHQAEA